MVRKGGPAMDEHRLVRRARRGDARAFTELVGRYQRPMHATAMSILHSEWDAADAVQNAFIAAFEHLGDLRDPDRFKAWLSRIVVNECRRTYRDKARLVVVEQPPDPPAPIQDVSREESLDLIRAIRTLDEDHRQVVALRYFCDLRLGDIAEVLGCPVGTVKSRLNRALARLQTMLRPGQGSAPGSDVQEVAP
jgi:RNA polymerase sigma-70 factor (ECF subfamily)